jgi:hypothetical protein
MKVELVRLPFGNLFSILDETGGEITIINLSDYAIDDLEWHAHLSKQPPQWQRTGPISYEKRTRHNILHVYKLAPRLWMARRGDRALVGADNTKVTPFKTYQEAQAAADRHERDGYQGATSCDDGLQWSRPTEVDEGDYP